MSELSIYLIKVSVSMAMFYGVYWFFMRKETFFRMNRFYMLTALLLSLILPFISIKYTVVSPENLMDDAVTANLSINPENNSFNIQTLITKIYYIGVIIFFIRIFWQFIILLSVILKSKVKVVEGTKIVYNKRFQMPFSFMNMIFINSEKIRESEISDIIAHEKVHIRESHWFDLLIVELISIILWFNPFIWFFERSVKQNHEYLADKGVIAQGFNANRYHSVLINQLMGMEVIGITNNLNYSLNTNRLKMMKKQKTSKIKALHLIWVVPIVIALLAAFAQPVYEDNVKNDLTTIGQKVNILVAVLDKDGNPMKGAVVFIKGSDRKAKTNEKGIFEMEVSKSDIIIIKNPGFEKGVIYMEKVVAKNGDAENYKFKLILKKEGQSTSDEDVEQQIKELELVLKELELKRKELEKMKKELTLAEKEDKIDKEILAKKKVNLKESYIAVNNKMEKVKKKLQYLKSQ